MLPTLPASRRRRQLMQAGLAATPLFGAALPANAAA